jgi:hypothetical protein
VSITSHFLKFQAQAAIDLDGWQNGWFWFVWGGFLRGDYLDRRTPIVALINKEGKRYFKIQFFIFDNDIGNSHSHRLLIYKFL